MFNVPERTVERARVVRDQGVPELAAQVEAGEVSVSAAEAVARLPEPEQRDALADGPAGIAAKAKEACERLHGKGGRTFPTPGGDRRSSSQVESLKSSFVEDTAAVRDGSTANLADAFTTNTAAVADAKRNRLTDAYAPVREAAKARQVEAVVRGNRARHETPVQEKVPELAKPAPQTRDIRAKAAGTNAKYIDVADRLVNERPNCPPPKTDAKPVMEAPGG